MDYKPWLAFRRPVNMVEHPAHVLCIVLEGGPMPFKVGLEKVLWAQEEMETWGMMWQMPFNGM